MRLDEDICFRAVQSRDPRFDGRFFTAVTSTGIYCRSTCPAKEPLRRNVRFFACAAAAEEAGFRPCRRCRPDSAPGTPVWNGASATVSRALRLIEAGALDEEASVDSLAERLGVGGRQLRRLFALHLGTSPLQVARSRRAHFARGLLDATDWPMTRVAQEAGFRSLRQFNEVMRAVFRRSPGELRRKGGLCGPGITLKLAYRPPYEWEALASFLRARAIPGVEAVEDGCYRRTFEGGWLQVRPGEGCALQLTLILSGHERGQVQEIAGRIRRMFDLDADPSTIGSLLGADPLLGPSLRAHPGLRVPGAFDPFEICVRAILGQQVSVRAATTLSGRLVAQFGTKVPGAPAGLTSLFPSPQRLAEAPIEGIGLPRARAESIRSVARSAGLLRESYTSLEDLVERLCALPGVGPWTAQYVAMRAFCEPDAFPAADLVLRKATGAPSTAALERQSQSWRPFRAYAALHLWSSFSHPEPHHDRAIAS